MDVPGTVPGAPLAAADESAESHELARRMQSYAAIALALAVDMQEADIAGRVWPALKEDVCGVALYAAAAGEDELRLRSQAGFGDDAAVGALPALFSGLGPVPGGAALQVTRFGPHERPAWLGAAAGCVVTQRFAGGYADDLHGCVLFAVRPAHPDRACLAMLQLAAQRMGASLSARAAGAAPPDRPAAVGEAAIKVVLIDDEPLLVAHVEHVLRRRGFEFHSASLAQSGLALAAAMLPHVILIDKVLPDMDGIEVLRALRRDQKLSTVPVIMLSGRADEVARIHALRAGADDFVAKPFSPKELVARIEANVRMAQARRAAVWRESELLRLRQSQHELRKLLDTIQNVRAEERRLLAREVHDQLGQMLTAVMIDLRLLDKRVKGGSATADDDETARELRSALSNVEQAIASVQNIAILLRPPALESGGLVATLRWLAADFQRRTKVSCTLAHDQQAYQEPSRFVAGELFRICQEALTNVARHAGASCVVIQVAVRGAHLIVRVCDNGVGIAPGSALRPDAIGMAGMRERAASILATAHFHGRAGRGSIIAIRRRLGVP